MPFVTSFEHVKRAVDAVDPLGLLAAGAPSDEYCPPIEDLVSWDKLHFTIVNLADFFWEWYEMLPGDDALEELRDRLVHHSGWHVVPYVMTSR